MNDSEADSVAKVFARLARMFMNPVRLRPSAMPISPWDVRSRQTMKWELCAWISYVKIARRICAIGAPGPSRFRIVNDRCQTCQEASSFARSQVHSCGSA